MLITQQFFKPKNFVSRRWSCLKLCHNQRSQNKTICSTISSKWALELHGLNFALVCKTFTDNNFNCSTQNVHVRWFSASPSHAKILLTLPCTNSLSNQSRMCLLPIFKTFPNTLKSRGTVEQFHLSFFICCWHSSIPSLAPFPMLIKTLGFFRHSSKLGRPAAWLQMALEPSWNTCEMDLYWKNKQLNNLKICVFYHNYYLAEADILCLCPGISICTG